MTSANLVQDLLADQSYHIEFNGHLTNHAKHAVVALAGLGAPPEKIKAYYDNYAKLTAYGFPLEPPRPSRHVITEDNWEHHLGARTSFSSYCEFFDREVDRHGLDEVVRRYVPRLLPGWAGAFTHATIHFGWGLDAGSRWMSVEGLAYLAYTYVPCHPERATASAAVDPAGSAVESLRAVAEAWDRDRDGMRHWVETVFADEAGAAAVHPELLRSGLQFRIARMLEVGHPLLYRTPAWLTGQDLAVTWEQLYYVATLLYLSRPGDFVLLHLVTSLHGMEQIAERLPEDQRLEVVRCYWIGLLGIVFAQADFPKPHKLAVLHGLYADSRDETDEPLWSRDWEQIVARAFEEEEEHNPKLVYVLRRLWQRSGGRTIYRAGAGQFTATPELPQSFEQPPTMD